MTRFVVDASVVVKWFLPEEHAAAARGLLADGNTLTAPDLVYAEVANVYWKHWRRGLVSTDEVSALLTDLCALPVRPVSSRSLIVPATELACLHERTVYDALYLALAEQLDCIMVTADQRLVNALARTALGSRVQWVGVL